MWVAASFFVALSTQPAELSGFELQWDAPEACPGGDDVSAVIAELLADTDALANTRVRAAVRVEARDDGFAMQVRVGEGARELVAPSCEELAATAAFLVAIAIDPRVLGRAAPLSVLRRPTAKNDKMPATTPDVATPPAAAPPTAMPPAPTTSQPTTTPESAATPTSRTPSSTPTRSNVATNGPRLRSRSVAIGGRVVGGVGLGPSPRTTGAFTASVGVVGTGFRAELEGQYWIPRSVSSSINGDVGLVAQLWTIGGRGCGVLARGRLEIPLCAVVQAGLIHARGQGDLESRRARIPWVGLGGGVMAIGWLGRRIGVGAGLDVLGSVVTGGFRSVPSGDVDRVGPIALTATLGVFWRSAAIRTRAVPETR